MTVPEPPELDPPELDEERDTDTVLPPDEVPRYPARRLPDVDRTGGTTNVDAPPR